MRGTANSSVAATPQIPQDLLPTAASSWSLLPTAATPPTPQDLLPCREGGHRAAGGGDGNASWCHHAYEGTKISS